MEGHMEIIEMGSMFDDPDYIGEDVGENWHDRPYGSATAATHVVDDDGNQVPLDCQMLNDQWSILAGVPGLWREEGAHVEIGQMMGGLFGSASIVNVGEGTLFSYDATALGDFHDRDGYLEKDEGAVVGWNGADDSLHVRPGNSFPSLNSGNLWAAEVQNLGGADGFDGDISYYRGIDAVSAVFMHDRIMNEYVLGGVAAAESEWVITFPTKGWYVDDAWAQEDGGEIWVNDGPCPYNSDHDNNVNTPNLIGDWVPYPNGNGSDGFVVDAEGDEFDNLAKPPACDVEEVDTFFGSDPFTSSFDGEACEQVGFDYWDVNEKASPKVAPGDDLPIVSPPPPGTDSPEGVDFLLCYETSVLQFGDSDIFGSRNTHTANVTAQAGWALIDFSIEDKKGKTIHVLPAADGPDLVGLPVTGFWAAKFVNGVLPGGVLANYGGLFDHKGSAKEHND
jgi:hypothetical protein